MRQFFFLLFCICILLTGVFGDLEAMELELFGGINNLSFHPEKMSAYTHPDEKNPDFQINPFWFGAVSLRDEIDKATSYNIGIERDSIMLNSISARMMTRTDYFMIEFGPFFGLNDDLKTPGAGIMGTFELIIPKIAFISFGGSSTLKSIMGFKNENTRESMEAELGFWLFNFAIISASANQKTNSVFFEKHNLTRRDTLTRYQLSIDLFVKNFPFSMRLDAGYQTLSRNYMKENEKEYIDEIKGYFAGTEMSLKVSQSLRILAGFELPLKYSSSPPMTVTDEFLRLFKAKAGFVYTFQKGIKKDITPEEKETE